MSTLTRRSLLLAGSLGAAAVAGSTAFAATARADGGWTEEFMTRIETREGFDVHAMTDWQVENARFIIAVGKAHGVGPRGIRMAISTAIVEAWLYNYGPEVDHDSGGLFQQRPAMGWGTYEQVRHKRLAVEAFLGVGDHTPNPGLLQLNPPYSERAFGEACQAVQRSAYPERYGQHEADAQLIWDRYAADVEPLDL